MGQALACKRTELAEERATDTMQGEIEMMEERLKDLKCKLWGVDNHGSLGCPPRTTPDDWEQLPGRAGGPRLSLWRTTKTTHTHGQGGSLQVGAPKTAMMWQIVKALEDDYTKLKGSQHLLRCQTPMRGQWEGEHPNQHLHLLWSPPHPAGANRDQSHWKLLLCARNKPPIIYLTALS